MKKQVSWYILNNKTPLGRNLPSGLFLWKNKNYAALYVPNSTIILNDAYHFKVIDNSDVDAVPEYHTIYSTYYESECYYTAPIGSWVYIQLKTNNHTHLYIRVYWGNSKWGSWHTLF